jgi:hypothetical protein
MKKKEGLIGQHRACGKSMFRSLSSSDADPKQACRLMKTTSRLGHRLGRVHAPSSKKASASEVRQHKPSDQWTLAAFFPVAGTPYQFAASLQPGTICTLMVLIIVGNYFRVGFCCRNTKLLKS